MPSNLDTENQLVKSLTDQFKNKIKTEYVKHNRIKISTNQDNLKSLATSVNKLFLMVELTIRTIMYSVSNIMLSAYQRKNYVVLCFLS